MRNLTETLRIRLPAWTRQAPGLDSSGSLPAPITFPAWTYAYTNAPCPDLRRTLAGRAAATSRCRLPLRTVTWPPPGGPV